MPDVPRRIDALHLLETLLKKSPPIVDLVQLQRIEAIGRRYHLSNFDDLLDESWERASKEKPEDLRLHKVWLKTMIRQRRWKAAQAVRPP